MTEGLKELVFQEANAVKQSPRVFSNQNRPQCPHSYPLVTPVLLFNPRPLLQTSFSCSILVPQSPQKQKASLSACLLFYMRILLTENIRCLRSASTLYNVKRNFFALSQRFETVSLNCGKMHEYIAAIFFFNKSITFFCAKPFYFTCHACSLLTYIHWSGSIL